MEVFLLGISVVVVATTLIYNSLFGDKK